MKITDGRRLMAMRVACSLFLPRAADSDRPNVVLMTSDDRDYEHLGFMGNDFVHTPHN